SPHRAGPDRAALSTQTLTREVGIAGAAARAEAPRVAPHVVLWEYMDSSRGRSLACCASVLGARLCNHGTAPPLHSSSLAGVAHPMTTTGDSMCRPKACQTVVLLIVLLLGVVASAGAPRSKSGTQKQRDVTLEPPTSTLPTAERRTALVIGNAAYAEGRLANP